MSAGNELINLEHQGLTELLTAALKLESNDSHELSLKLKRSFPDSSPQLLGLAVETTIARIRATELGAWTQSGLFTKSALEQASHPALARRHAERFKGCKRVLEIGTGLGFDTAALAGQVKQVVSLEADYLVCECAKRNLALQEIENVELRCEAFAANYDLRAFDAIWADPARRNKDGSRVGDPELYNPPLSTLMRIAGTQVIGIKISPGYNFRELPTGWSREWIGYAKDCREQVLWYGASVADGTVYLADCQAEWQPGASYPRTVLPSTDLSGQYLIEPHGALIRSGYLENFFGERKFAFLDPKIAYAVSNITPERSPFYERFLIIAAFPFSLKTINRYLKELKWGRACELKKRGFPEEPERLRSKFRFCEDSSKHGVIILTRVGSGHLAMLAERVHA